MKNLNTEELKKLEREIEMTFSIRTYIKPIVVTVTALIFFNYFSIIKTKHDSYVNSMDIFQMNEFGKSDIEYGISNFSLKENNHWISAPHVYEHIKNKLDTDNKETTTSSILAEGASTWYSREGCYHCSTSLTMSNGDILDDSELTLAVTPELWREQNLKNQHVLVTNLDNNKTIISKVTDTGGFGAKNKVADLNVATSQMLECYNCRVRIERINNIN